MRPFERGFSVPSGKPTSAAFDSAGNLLVLQQGTVPVIEKIDTDGKAVAFTASESYITGNKLTGTPVKPFAFDTNTWAGIAVDRSGGPRNGDIYVGQANTTGQPAAMHVFEASGKYRGALAMAGPVCGAAVNQSNGDLYSADYYSARVRRYATGEGTPATYPLKDQLNTNGSLDCQIAVNNAGDLYLSGYPSSAKARKFAASQFGAATSPGVFTLLGTKTASQFAIDPAIDGVYAATGTEISHFAADGSALPTIATGDLVQSGALARAADGRLYVFEANQQVSVYGPTALDLPAITTGSATAVERVTATLAGKVDPDSAGDVEDCYFKYGTDQSLSSGTVPCTPTASSEAPYTETTSVTANITGLAPGTTYYYRLFAENGNGVGAGVDGTFTTKVAVLGVTTGNATSVTKDSALLGGSYTGDGEDVSYRFEYGTTTSYGKSQPVAPGANAGTGSGAQTVTPIEIDDLLGATTYHYRLVATNQYGSSYGADKTFTTLAAVTNLATDPPSNVTGETADLNGSFTADDYETSYYFEYGQSKTYGQTAPIPPGNNAGTGSGKLMVDPVTISGLQLGSRYHYRIVASNSRGTTIGPDQSFRTADVPAIRSFWSDDLTATSAKLFATINPQDGDTSYHFEYGMTSDYGSVTPEPDGHIGDGLEDSTVSVELDNLVAGATYHFRVVATNQYGTSATGDQTFNFYPAQCPNAQVRAETNSGHVPDCRAYELASPSQAGGLTIFPVGGPNTGLASTPARLAFLGGFGAVPGSGDPINTIGDLYVATRSDIGWTTKYMGLAGNKTLQMGSPPEAGLTSMYFQGPTASQLGTQASPDMSMILNYDNGMPGEASVPGSNAPYIWDADTNEQVDRWPTNLDEIEKGATFVGTPRASADFSHFVFTSNIPFAEGGVVFPNTGAALKAAYRGSRARSNTVYDNDIATGEVKVASVKPNGDVYRGIPVGIAADGSRIVISEGDESILQAGAQPSALRVRVEGETTYEIAGGQPVIFVSMTKDAQTVYFTSPNQLTTDDDDTSVDLFRWDESNPEAVTRVSFGQGPSAGNSDGCAVTWVQKCGIRIIDFSGFDSANGGDGGNRVSDHFTASESGDIYFLSPEQLEGARGEHDQVNLYVYRDGGVMFVAKMENKALTYPAGGTSLTPVARMQVTPSGSHVAFITNSQITAYNNAGKGQMYRFEPATRTLLCVSCKANGEPPVSDVYGSQNGLFITDDGRSFFSTNDAIVRQDTNKATDVYEFADGRPQLLTTGIGVGIPAGKYTGFTGYLAKPGLIGVSADGVDAYFATLETLVSQDHNGEQLKIYDARTNGGFPSDLRPPNCEAADECHGPGSGPPPPLIAGTEPNLGKSGNVVPQVKKAVKKPVKKAKKQRRAKRKAARKAAKKRAMKRAQLKAKRSLNGSKGR